MGRSLAGYQSVLGKPRMRDSCKGHLLWEPLQLTPAPGRCPSAQMHLCLNKEGIWNMMTFNHRPEKAIKYEIRISALKSYVKYYIMLNFQTKYMH